MYDQFMRAAPQVEESFAIPGLHIKHLFGFITTITVYAFIFAQITVGILFDRFNIRILLPFAIFCSSLRMYLMVWSVYLVISFIAKCFLMVGSPFAFLSVLVMIARWFPNEKFVVLADVG